MEGKERRSLVTDEFCGTIGRQRIGSIPGTKSAGLIIDLTIAISTEKNGSNETAYSDESERNNSPEVAVGI